MKTGSVEGCSVLPETQIVRDMPARRHHTGLICKGFHSPMGYSPPRLPVIPLTTRSQQVVFAYDQVIRRHHSYHSSGGLLMGEPQSHHKWICLQMSGARRVDNSVNTNTQYIQCVSVDTVYAPCGAVHIVHIQCDSAHTLCTVWTLSHCTYTVPTPTLYMHLMCTQCIHCVL